MVDILSTICEHKEQASRVPMTDVTRVLSEYTTIFRILDARLRNTADHTAVPLIRLESLELEREPDRLEPVKRSPDKPLLHHTTNGP